MKFEDYLIIYKSTIKGKKECMKFWCITLLTIGAGIQIQMDNGHYLTIEDCWKEINDALQDYIFEGGQFRAWWEQFQWLRGLIDKPGWV